MESTMKKNNILFIMLFSGLIFTFSAFAIPDAHAATNANLFVSTENSQWNNYFAGPQVIQVIVADPDINRLDQAYGEPVVTVNGKRLRMAQATDGNWYAYFADRNQAIAAANTAALTGKGLNFGAFCDPTSTFSPMPGVTYAETSGFTLARGGFGAVNHTSTFTITSSNLGACTNIQGTLTTNQMEHVVRQNKTLNSNPSGFNAPYSTYSQVWPVIQLYDFSTIPTTVTVDYQKSGGDQIVNLTFDRIPQNLITTTVDENAYPQNSQVKTQINDPQLNIDPTEEDSWTWGTNANNNTLYYEVFTRNGATDADGTTGMQNLIGNLTTFMFNHNGKLTIDAAAQGVRIIDFQSNGKQTYTGIQRGDPLLVRTSSIGVGSQPITMIEQGGVNTGVFGNWDSNKESGIITLNSPTIKGHSATVRYNDMSTNILASNGTPTTTTISSSLNPSTFGQSVTFTATVSPSTATGSMAFTIDGTPSTQIALTPGGVVSTIASTGLGHPSGIAINSAGNYIVIDGGRLLSVTPGGTVSVITSTNLGYPSGVAINSAGNYIVADNGGRLLSVTFGGTATYSTSSLSVGTHTISTAYSGDVNDAASTSSQLTQTILTPTQATQNLLLLVDGMHLKKGTTESLDEKLKDIIKDLTKGNNDDARKDLLQFIDKVKSQTGKSITTIQSTQLTSAAQAIIDSLQNSVKGKHDKDSPSPVTQGTVSIVAGSGASPSATCVTTNNCFSPNPLTIAHGTTITWQNADKVGHTVTSGKITDTNPGSLFDSGLVKPGNTFQFTFINSGTYYYFDTVHPWITGQIIVH